MILKIIVLSAETIYAAHVSLVISVLGFAKVFFNGKLYKKNALILLLIHSFAHVESRIAMHAEFQHQAVAWMAQAHAIFASQVTI